MSVTVCPSRLLAESEADDVLSWWLESTPWDYGFSGAQPAGPPEWPYPGGWLAQPAKLVDAVRLLRAELPHVPRPEPAKDEKRDG